MGQVVPWIGLVTMRQFARLTLYAPIPEDEKRREHEGRPVIWQIATRRSTYKHLSKRSLLYKARRKIEKVKAQA
jgi:hypothetical protein